MKLLIIRPHNIFSECGASANRWIAILEGLSRYEIDICLLITSGYKSQNEKSRYGRLGNINKGIHYIYITDQNRYNLWKTRLNFYLLSGLYCLQNVKRIRKVILNLNPDFIFLSPSVEVFRIIPRLFAKNLGGFKLAIELTEYDDTGEKHLTNYLQKIVQKRYTHYLFKEILPRIDICLVISQTLMDYYSKIPGINPRTSFFKVPIIVDFDRFKETKELNYDLKKPYIAYCGSSSFYKDGVNILIQSFKEISAEFPDLLLYIAAFWEIDGHQMIGLINALDMNDRIKYLGTLSREEIPSFLNNAKILALPRPDSRQAQGGFPTKLGEYLASGNPVCATRVSEIPLYLEDNESAFLSEPGNIKSFEDSLRRALSDDSNAKRVGEMGKSVANSFFSIEVQSKRLFEFLVTKMEG